MTKVITHREKERILFRSAVILLAFVAVGILVTYPLPREQRLPPISVALVSGVVAACIYSMPRLARNLEDALWGYSATSMLAVIFAGGFYLIYLREAGLEMGIDFLMFGCVVPLSLVAMATTYEIMDHRKSKTALGLHVKRFTGRMTLLVVFLTMFFAFSYLLALISPGSEVTTVALAVSGLATGLILLLLARRSKTREFLIRLERGEW